MTSVTGTGEAVFERDERGGFTVVVDGYPQSYVHPDDPLLLAFEYVEHLGALLDTLAPGPVRVTHVGGGGLTCRGMSPRRDRGPHRWSSSPTLPSRRRCEPGCRCSGAAGSGSGGGREVRARGPP